MRKKKKGLPQRGCGHHLKVHTYEFGLDLGMALIVLLLSTDIP